MWFAHEGMGWWMVFGSIGMIMFWGIIIALGIWGIRRLAEQNDSGSAGGGGHSPLDVAKSRYARGEITKEEFEQIKKDLS